MFFGIRNEGVAVYPRVCGGNVGEGLIAVSDAGLSPRVRGKREQPGTWYKGNRSIPACAGETGCWQPIHTPCGVYPRVCGGNSAVC